MERSFKRFASDENITHRRNANCKTASRNKHTLIKTQSTRRILDANFQRLRFGKPFCLKVQLDFSIIVRRSLLQFAARKQLILHFFIGQRRTVIVRKFELAADFIATKIHLFLDIKCALNRFELVLRNNEPRLERKCANLIVGPTTGAVQVDSVAALRRIVRQNHVGFHGAELIKLDLLCLQLASARIINIQLEFCSLLESESILLNPPHDAFDIH